MIWQALTDDVQGFFTTPFPLLATLNTQNGVLKDEMKNAKLKVPGAEAAKVTAKLAVKLTLDAALDYVNGLARLNQPNAAEIITSAQMMVISPRSVNKQEFSVKQGAATGEMKLSSLAVRIDNKFVKATYDWQSSIDGGATWVSLPSTVVAKTVATGMRTGVPTLFRKRTISVKGGISAWSVPIEKTPM
ncbi:MAG: hypothetical protein ABI855_16610 [Bacteroidota bacterium]